jgi:hypothetical protein
MTAAAHVNATFKHEINEMVLKISPPSGTW